MERLDALAELACVELALPEVPPRELLVALVEPAALEPMVLDTVAEELPALLVAGRVTNVDYPFPLVAGNTETHPRLANIVIGAMSSCAPERAMASENRPNCSVS